jgi:hypothetical protein
MAGNRDCRGRSCDNHPQTTFMTSFGCAVVYPRHNAPAFASDRYWVHSSPQNFANRPHSFPTSRRPRRQPRNNIGATHALQIIGDIAYHDYEGTGRNPEERARLLADLGHRHILVLRNHGLLIVGTSVAAAFVATYRTERACRDAARLPAIRAWRSMPTRRTRILSIEAIFQKWRSVRLGQT